MTRLTQILSLALGSALLTGTAAAQEAQSADLDALLACRTIEQDSARLACMDARLEELAGAIESRSIAVVDREHVRAVERDGFGLSMPGLGGLTEVFRGGSEPEDAETLEDGTEIVYDDSGAIDEMRNVPVEVYETTRTGDLRITLANGQVWQQIDTTRIRVPRSQRGDLRADIRGGALGSHFMTLSYGGRAFRARRIQ
jgi:hypothetical protein